tara:strand:- start:1298 stop:1576 length:279 start_codon:yes stop_codon:yes gene_type:complete
LLETVNEISEIWLESDPIEDGAKLLSVDVEVNDPVIEVLWVVEPIVESLMMELSEPDGEEDEDVTPSHTEAGSETSSIGPHPSGPGSLVRRA